jgi:hypothetical protein
LNVLYKNTIKNFILNKNTKYIKNVIIKFKKMMNEKKSFSKLSKLNVELLKLNMTTKLQNLIISQKLLNLKQAILSNCDNMFKRNNYSCEVLQTNFSSSSYYTITSNLNYREKNFDEFHFKDVKFDFFSRLKIICLSQKFKKRYIIGFLCKMANKLQKNFIEKTKIKLTKLNSFMKLFYNNILINKQRSKEKSIIKLELINNTSLLQEENLVDNDEKLINIDEKDRLNDNYLKIELNDSLKLKIKKFKDYHIKEKYFISFFSNIVKEMKFNKSLFCLKVLCDIRRSAVKKLKFYYVNRYKFKIAYFLKKLSYFKMFKENIELRNEIIVYRKSMKECIRSTQIGNAIKYFKICLLNYTKKISKYRFNLKKDFFIILLKNYKYQSELNKYLKEAKSNGS